MATLAPTLAGCSADLATQHARFLCSGAGAVDYDTGAPQNASCATAEDQTDVVIVTGTALNRREAIDEKRADSGTIEALGVNELGQLQDKNFGKSLNRLPGARCMSKRAKAVTSRFAESPPTPTTSRSTAPRSASI
jgi:hypothetical protein